MMNSEHNQPESGLLVSSQTSVIAASVPFRALTNVHPLQLCHVPQVIALQLFQPPVVLLVGEVNVLLPLQAVDFQRQGAADAFPAFAFLTGL